MFFGVFFVDFEQVFLHSIKSPSRDKAVQSQLSLEYCCWLETILLAGRKPKYIIPHETLRDRFDELTEL